ncbi:MAG: hypothetical protein PHU25_16430 [Deltaproteobacteria bacterium]|nr:hypothetical protein [Deltaproteobacteria bacterium]
MAVQTIILRESEQKKPLKVRFASLPSSEFWQYVGTFTGETQSEPRGQVSDLNRVAQVAATLLAAKVANRLVSVEMVIDPVIPPVAIPEPRLLPLVAAITDNASASVEPGPGMVLVTTWWRGRTVGIDAVGVGGALPPIIRENLMRPGFSTRVAGWDTGFGLYETIAAAAAFGAKVELLEPPEGVCFRLSLPLRRGTPASPPEKQDGLGEEGERGATAAWASEEGPFDPRSLDLLHVIGHARNDEPIQA